MNYAVLPREIKDVVDKYQKILREQWGLERNFAQAIAIFLLYLAQYGLSPVITSGYRSPAKQASLQQRYAAGDTSVVVKPATNSKHSKKDFLGNPASEAIDISTNNPRFSAAIAEALGIGTGIRFNPSDPVHYYYR